MMTRTTKTNNQPAALESFSLISGSIILQFTRRPPRCWCGGLARACFWQPRQTGPSAVVPSAKAPSTTGLGGVTGNDQQSSTSNDLFLLNPHNHVPSRLSSNDKSKLFKEALVPSREASSLRLQCPLSILYFSSESPQFLTCIALYTSRARHGPGRALTFACKDVPQPQPQPLQHQHQQQALIAAAS